MLTQLPRLPAGSHCVVIDGEGHGLQTDHAARLVFPTFFRWLEVST